MKWECSPCVSPGRACRVVADTLSASSGTRSRSRRMSVPLPTPDGPVITNTRAKESSALLAEHADELGTLAIREAADRLRRRDPAGLQDLVGLHAPVLRDRQEHVEDLGGLEELGRLEQELVDRHSTGLQVALELRATCTDDVRLLKGVHPLVEAAFGCRRVLGGRVGGRRHRGADTTRPRVASKPRSPNSAGPRPEVHPSSPWLMVPGRFAGTLRGHCNVPRTGPAGLLPVFAAFLARVCAK